MGLQTISRVSRDYGISARMLRYYENAGLIRSMRKDGYAYRVYDENAVNRLRQIIVLRKLRVPVKQIISILNNSDAAEAVEIFRQNISKIDSEITALSTVKSILTRFVEEINEKADVNLKLLSDEAVFSVVGSLSFSGNQIKETKEGLSLEELDKADEELMKLEDRDVRIVYLPPMMVAAVYAFGDNCEGRTGEMIKQFVTESGLIKIKPDARSFGFDCSARSSEIDKSPCGYEMWVSVPEDMKISAPFIKRSFNGGLYAAHVLRTWDFADRGHLEKWVAGGDRYDSDWDLPRWESPETVPGQVFEETLNFYNFIQSGKMENMQLDILIPIKERENG